MLWHDGYPVSMLGHSGSPVDGAVIVEEHDAGWAVYRRRGDDRESLRLHVDAMQACDDALHRIYDICAAEGI